MAGMAALIIALHAAFCFREEASLPIHHPFPCTADKMEAGNGDLLQWDLSVFIVVRPGSVLVSSQFHLDCGFAGGGIVLFRRPHRWQMSAFVEITSTAKHQLSYLQG